MDVALEYLINLNKPELQDTVDIIKYAKEQVRKQLTSEQFDYLFDSKLYSQFEKNINNDEIKILYKPQEHILNNVNKTYNMFVRMKEKLDKDNHIKVEEYIIKITLFSKYLSKIIEHLQDIQKTMKEAYECNYTSDDVIDIRLKHMDDTKNGTKNDEYLNNIPDIIEKMLEYIYDDLNLERINKKYINKMNDLHEAKEQYTLQYNVDWIYKFNTKLKNIQEKIDIFTYNWNLYQQYKTRYYNFYLYQIYCLVKPINTFKYVTKKLLKEYSDCIDAIISKSQLPNQSIDILYFNTYHYFTLKRLCKFLIFMIDTLDKNDIVDISKCSNDVYYDFLLFSHISDKLYNISKKNFSNDK
jgi:hypothetical protein